MAVEVRSVKAGFGLACRGRRGKAVVVRCGVVRFVMVRSVVVRLGKAVMARSGEVCWGQECFGMVRQSLARQGLDWFGKAVEVGQVAVGRVVEWLDEERHGSYGVFRQVGSRLC